MRFFKIILAYLCISTVVGGCNLLLNPTSHWPLSNNLIRKPIPISGQIISIPKSINHTQSFDVVTDHINDQVVKAKLHLSWFNVNVNVHAGDSWFWIVKLKPPTGLKNPGAFDYKEYLIENNISATGYIAESDKNHLMKHYSVFNINAIRQNIQTFIFKAIKDQSNAAIIAALTVGSRSSITPDQWQIFQLTGTNHLIAIAGLHIGFVVGFIYLIASFLWRLSARLPLILPASQLAGLIAIIGAISYVALSGFALPAQRAIIMLTVLMTGQLLLRSGSVWYRWLLAMLLVIALQPSSIKTASFWLSFSSIAWILYALLGSASISAHWRQWNRIQWSIFLGLFPLTLLFFQSVSLVMLAANFLAIPWVGFILLPFSLFSLSVSLFNHSLGQILLAMLGHLVTPLWIYLTWLSHWRALIWFHAILSPWVLIAGIMAAIILLSPKAWPARWFGFLFLLPVIFYRGPQPDYQDVWLSLLDVGQGLSAVVHTQHHVMLFDAGPKSVTGFDAGQSIVVPYLRAQGISSIDEMVISHGDMDHIGGADAVIAGLSVHQIDTSVPEKFSKSNAIHCYDGQHWQWDGIDFRVLWPPKGQSYEANNSSCVVQVSRNGRGLVLLTGDIEQQAEDALVKKYRQQLESYVIVVPHHGSHSSSSADFVQNVRPKYALFPVGLYNRYRFPAQSVLERYHQYQSTLLSTALRGAIELKLLKSNEIKVETAK